METEVNNEQAIAKLTGTEGVQEQTDKGEGTQTDTGGQPSQTTETQAQLDIESLNTFLEIPEQSKFKSAEDFKSYYTDMRGRWDQYKDLEKVKKDLKEGQEALELHTKEIEELYQNANPEKIFGSLDNYRNHLIKEQVTKDGTLDRGTVDVILNSDIDKLDELDLVYYHKKLNTPGLDDEQALYDLVFNDLGKREEDLQDEDGKDLPIDTKADLYKILKPHESARLKKMANDAKKEFLSIKNTEVQADNNYFTSFQAKREADKKANEDKINQLRESWKPVYDSFHDIKSVQLIDEDKEGNKQVVFDFPIDGEVLSKIDKSVEEYVLIHGIEPNDENKQQVRNAFINGYAGKNWEKLVRAALTQSAQSVKEQNIKERENRQPMNTQVNTETKAVDISKINADRLAAAGL